MVKIDLIPSVLWKINSIFLPSKYSFLLQGQSFARNLLIAHRGRAMGWDEVGAKKDCQMIDPNQESGVCWEIPSKILVGFSSCKVLAVNDRSQIPSPSRLEFGLCSSKFGETSYYESWSQFFLCLLLSSPQPVSMQFGGTTREPTKNRRLKGKYAHASNLLKLWGYWVTAIMYFFD